MLRKIFYILIGFALCLVFISSVLTYGIQRNIGADPVAKDLETIKSIANTFEDKLASVGIEKEEVDNAIAAIEKYNKAAKYVIEFDIKNDTNPILSTSLHLPVDEEFFNSVNVGDKIAQEEFEKFEEFAQVSAKLGGWTITVKEKFVRTN